MTIDNLPAEVSDYLKMRVWSGFYQRDELIKQMIEDLERAADGGELFIAFSAKSGRDEDGVPIANEIVSTLRSHNLAVHRRASNYPLIGKEEASDQHMK